MLLSCADGDETEEEEVEVKAREWECGCLREHDEQLDGSEKPCNLDDPQAVQWPVPVGLRNVHLEHAHELKSGLDGDAGVNRTDSPRTSMTSAPEPGRDPRHASQRPADDEGGAVGAEHPGHFQEGGDVTGGEGLLGSSSSSMLRRLIG